MGYVICNLYNLGSVFVGCAGDKTTFGTFSCPVCGIRIRSPKVLFRPTRGLEIRNYNMFDKVGFFRNCNMINLVLSRVSYSIYPFVCIV